MARWASTSRPTCSKSIAPSPGRRLPHARPAADAEDVVQDALSRALPRWERISRVEDVDAYVRRMVVKAHTSWWRKFRRRESPTSVVVDSGETVAGPGDGPGHDERQRLWAACRALPEAQRTAVVLRYYEQLEYDEIAALTGVAEGTGPVAGVPRPRGLACRARCGWRWGR